MAFIVDTFARAVFKRLLGLAHTSNTRDPANEAVPSGFQMAAQEIWGEAINPTPGHASNLGKVSSLVTLNLEPVSGTDNVGGKYASYRCKLGDTVPASLVGKMNRLTGSNFAAYDYVGYIIPIKFGSDFRPKLFRGNDAEVPPLDACDWFLDTYSGVLTQETDTTANMVDFTTDGGGYVQGYIYVGKTVDQITGDISGSIQFHDKQTIGAGITGDVDGNNTDFVLDYTPDPSSLHIWVNGILTLDYILNGATITFGTAPDGVIGGNPADSIIASYREA